MEEKQPVNGEWGWVGRYLAVIVVSLLLAAALGNMELFTKTRIGGLTASKIVQFLGYGAALATLWVLGQRATVVLQQREGNWSFLRHLILPAVSLLVVSLAYSVLLLVLKPVMGQSMLNLYNWLFIIGILACAGWLVMAVLNQSTSLTAMFTQRMTRTGRSCPACGAGCETGDRYCRQCGKPLA